MGDFSAAWLALREPADFSARSSQLADVIASALANDDTVQALDMASGTGSNVRYLAERLPPRQDWLLVDHDQGLITHAPVRMSEWAAARGYDARVEADGVLLLQGDRLKCRRRTCAAWTWPTSPTPRCSTAESWLRRRRCWISSPSPGCGR